jgi:hypothetical protein
MQSTDALRERGLVAILLVVANFEPAAATTRSLSVQPFGMGVVTTMLASTKIVSTPGFDNESFGSSIALSGNTALVGACCYQYYPGAAYIFTFNGNSWVQQQIGPSDGLAMPDHFGTAVALSGTKALVGTPGKTIGSNTAQGAVYVFTFNGNSWIQQQKLTASDGAMGDGFGTSVSLSGGTAIVGANKKVLGSGANTAQGAAYVFTYDGTSWTQQQRLAASDGASNDQFGLAVAVSGSTALIGAPYKAIGFNTSQGATYVFAFNGSTWVQKQILGASDGHAYDNFGSSVAVSGTAALVGAYDKTMGSHSLQGSAYVFAFDGASWLEQQELSGSDSTANDYFGSSVALDGSIALVGAYARSTAYVFQNSAGQWYQQQELTASDAAPSGFFGSAVALSGPTALVGARGNFIGSYAYQGAGYVFSSVTDTIFRDGFEGP